MIFTASSAWAAGATVQERVLADSLVGWAFAGVPILLGLTFHVVTVGVAGSFIHDCLRKRKSKPMSGFPFLGPLLIDLGLYWSPADIPGWSYALPWAIEILAAVASVIVQKRTGAR